MLYKNHMIVVRRHYSLSGYFTASINGGNLIVALGREEVLKQAKACVDHPEYHRSDWIGTAR